MNHSATKSGLDLLGLVLSLVVASMVAGVAVKKTGKYLPFLFLGPALCAIGGGLLSTIKARDSVGKIIGFEILIGAGIGSFFQLGMLAAQAEYAKQPHIIGKVTGVTTFTQMLGGLIGLAVGGSIFADKLSQNLDKYAPGVDAKVASSPTDIRTIVSGDQLQAVIHAYTDSLRWAYITIVPLAGYALICAIFIKNRPLLGGHGAKAEKPASETPTDEKKPTSN
jgi:MFS family permease